MSVVFGCSVVCLWCSSPDIGAGCCSDMPGGMEIEGSGTVSAAEVDVLAADDEIGVRGAALSVVLDGLVKDETAEDEVTAGTPGLGA